MKKYNIIITICIVSFLLLSIVGCKEEEGGISQKDPFIGGTTGLLLSFVKSAPPEEVFDSGDFPFDIEVKLENDGEYDIAREKCRVKIRGIKPSDFGLSESDFVKYPEDSLDGKKKDAQGTIIDGTTTYVTFTGFNYLGNVAGNTNYPIYANVCYKYGTKTMSQLCVKENLLKEDSDVCKVTEKKQAFNSGGPVQISEFEESARGTDRITFTFKVVHKGNGNIFGRDTNCDQSRANENKVWVDVNTGIAGAECTGLSGGTATSGYVTLYEGERGVRCTQPVSTNVDYVKPVNINLEYDYSDDISTTIIVKPVD
jgi:hypothetical protein